MEVMTVFTVSDFRTSNRFFNAEISSRTETQERVEEAQPPRKNPLRYLRGLFSRWERSQDHSLTQQTQQQQGLTTMAMRPDALQQDHLLNITMQHHDPENDPQPQLPSNFGPSILMQALMRHYIALASMVPWLIAIFTMIQLRETLVIAPLIISFGCFFAWLVIKVVHFVYCCDEEDQRGESAGDEEQVGQSTNDPPPYEIVVTKPPPYDQLVFSETTTTPPGPSYPRGMVHSISGSKGPCFNSEIYEGCHACSRCHNAGSGCQPDEDACLPTYEQALVLMAKTELQSPIEKAVAIDL